MKKPNYGNRFDKISERKHKALSSKGGRAHVPKGRATIADPERRREIARAAAMVRWHGKENGGNNK